MVVLYNSLVARLLQSAVKFMPTRVCIPRLVSILCVRAKLKALEVNVQNEHVLE